MPWPPDPPQSFTQFITTVFDTPQGWKLIGFGTGIGFVFAVLALSVSVVSFPMLLDRPIDAEAMDVEIEHPVVAPTIDVPIAIISTAKSWNRRRTGETCGSSKPLAPGLYSRASRRIGSGTEAATAQKLSDDGSAASG